MLKAVLILARSRHLPSQSKSPFCSGCGILSVCRKLFCNACDPGSAASCAQFSDAKYGAWLCIECKTQWMVLFDLLLPAAVLIFLLPVNPSISSIPVVTFGFCFN